MKVTIKKPKTRVLLTVECRDMRNPKLQRSQFDQTLASNSWMLQENRKADVHGDGTVTTVSVWGRTFGYRKTVNEIEKLTGNLLNRAARYAGIDTYQTDFQFEKIPDNAEGFDLAPVLFSDD